MHERLSEILEQEVVGQLVRQGGAVLDVGLGRLCLDRLDPERIEALVERLRTALGPQIQVQDNLHLDAPGQPVRGLVSVSIPDEVGGVYLLQITAAPVLAFYERRFLLEPELYGNVMGVLGQGLPGLFVAGRERPVRLLSGYAELWEAYLDQLDEALVAAQEGRSADEVELWVGDLLEPLRACWRMIPWPLRSGVEPLFRAGSGQTAQHRGGLGRTVLLAVRAGDGKVVTEYVHQHHELEEYGEAMGWIFEVHQALAETYPPPAHATAVARASSVRRLQRCFPGLQSLILAPDEEPPPPPTIPA